MNRVSVARWGSKQEPAQTHRSVPSCPSVSLRLRHGRWASTLVSRRRLHPEQSQHHSADPACRAAGMTGAGGWISVAVLSACLPAVSGLTRRRRPGLIDHPARSITHPSAPLACQRCL
ncbi:hypothetical protein AAFF_G00213380 [Aldrovandia affinis]|uniref:Uncharacterized protein n=1 Tax=Aldrovandia affinis TaxID=143900 RepID=A0AAD7VVU4_9TELE|nr:hypothetical protein AAFF_G00213380 [Aldrovandia affinis]